MQACELEVLQAGLQYIVAVSNKKQYKMVCVDKGNCTFFVNGRAVAKPQCPGEWKVTTLNLQHSCDGTGARRKREVNVRTLDRSSVAAKAFQRPPGRRKDTTSEATASMRWTVMLMPNVFGTLRASMSVMRVTWSFTGAVGR